jgi:O-antigen/teichoic acid export membrane protein
MGSIKKNYLYNLLYQILSLIVPLITTPYVTRILKVEGIGKFSYYFSITNYFVIFIMLGLNTYGNRCVAKFRNNKLKLSKFFLEIYISQFFMGILISILYLIFCYYFSNEIILSSIMGIYILAAIFDINWFFMGLEKFKLITIRNLLIKFLSTILIFIFVKNENDIILYSFILSFCVLLNNAILWRYVLKNIYIIPIKLKNIFKHLKPNLYLFLTTIAVSIFKIMDKIMLGIMINTKEVGYYEASEKIINIPIIMIVALGTVMLPRITNMLATNDNKNTEKLMENSIKFAFFLSTSIGFGIMGISKEFVPFFYGVGYEKCIDLFLILLPSCIFLAFANVIRTQFIIPKGFDEIYVKSAFIGAGINILINIILIPKFAAIGAAIGTLFAEIGVCVYQVGRVRKYLPIKKYIVLGIPFLASGIFMFLIIYFLEFIVFSREVLILIKILLGAIIYFIFLGTQLYLIKILRRQ